MGLQQSLPAPSLRFSAQRKLRIAKPAKILKDLKILFNLNMEFICIHELS
jgi:hypothetical protein